MSEWVPAIGDIVWLNYPDSDKPEGRVVGFVTDEMPHRAGQPIIERIEDEPPALFLPGYKRGDRTVIHPAFLLPFRFRGPEWKQAEAEGRIRP